MSEQDEVPSEDRRKYEFRKVIEELKDYEGSGTQLVTIYIPRTSRSRTSWPTSPRST